MITVLASTSDAADIARIGYALVAGAWLLAVIVTRWRYPLNSRRRRSHVVT